MSQERATALSHALRTMAYIVQQNPEAIDVLEHLFRDCHTMGNATEVEQFVSVFKRYAKTGDGWAGIDKRYTDNYATISGYVGNIRVEVTTARANVCERKVVGQKEVTREVTDPNAPLIVVTEIVDNIEWVCHPLLED